MRLLLSVAAIWLTAILVIGILGASWLNAWFKTSQDTLLVREAALIAAIVKSTEWSEPCESDPRWEAMESRWQVEAIPIYQSESSASAAVQFVAADDTSSQTNEWSRLKSGQWRLSRVVAIDNTQITAVPLIGLRITRVATANPILRLWWGLAIGLLVAGCTASSYLAWSYARDSRLRQSAFVPWVQAVQQTTNSLDAALPMIQHQDEELERQFSLVCERVNAWLNDLQNKIQRSELVLSNLQEGVLAVDDKSRVLLANAALDRLLGVASENYLYRTMVEVFRVPRLVALVERVLASHTAQEESFEHGSQQLSLRLLARPIPLGNNRFGALVTVRDETPLRRVEQVRRDFVTNASHELKTPLAAIRAYAETLQMGAHEDAEACQQFLGGILTQADRVNALINGMLQLARVQSNSVTLKRIRFDVCSAIVPCVDATEAVATAKNIEITKSIPTEPLFIVGDPESVQTILSNLISNAVRYTPEGGRVSLEIAARGNQLVIQVTDTGIGIGKEDLSRVFERFYRVERARSQETGGTGLGLSIVKHLTQALGGEVFVTSELNVGSCFEVRLPLE